MSPALSRARGNAILPTMNFEEFTNAVGGDAEALRKNFAALWEKMSATLPPEKYACAYLAPEALKAHWAMSPLRDDSLPELLALAEQVRGDETLLALAALMHFALFEDAEGPGAWNIPYPAGRFATEESQGLLNFLVALGFCPVFARLNRARGIPGETISATLGQIACYANNFHRAFGHAGIYRGQLSWLHTYMPPRRYFRIGRLEFCQQPYSRSAVAYRNKTTGEIAAFAAPGLKFMPDGRLCRTDEKAPADALETIREEANGFARGNRIGKNARIEATPVALPLADWECVLRQGDPIMEMHIPSGGGMGPDLVRDAMKRSFAFFDKYFPGNGAKALTCGSWILSAQLQEALPDGSNILALQDMVHLVPVAPSAGCDGGLWFLFLSRPPYDPKALPRDTSMRRAVAEWMEKGETFCAGEMFILRDEVARL